MRKRYAFLMLALLMVLSCVTQPMMAFAANPDNTDKKSAAEYAQWKENLLKNESNKKLSELKPLDATFVGNDWIRNEYIEAKIDGYGDFTMGTTGGNPNLATDNNKLLLYGHPYPGTSFTTIQVGGDNYEFYSDTQTPITSSNGEENVSIQTINGIVIKQILSFYLNPNTGRKDMVQIKYELTNTTDVTKSTGVRIMLDTMLGDNDGAPFKIEGIGDCLTEMEFIGDAIPRSWQAFDDLSNPSVISDGTFYYQADERPDKVQFADWRQIYNTIWDYQVTEDHFLTSDSAVAAYFYPKALEPGKTRTVVTYYGLNAFTVQDLRPPLAVSVFAPQVLALNNARDGYAPNPITVTAHIENVGNSTASNASANIVLPAEASVADGGSTVIQLGNMEPGEKQQISWIVRVANQSESAVLSYSIVANADEVEPKTLVMNLSVPAVPVAEAKITSLLLDGWSHLVSGSSANLKIGVKGENLTGRHVVFTMKNADNFTVYESDLIDASDSFETMLRVSAAALTLPAGNYTFSARVAGGDSTMSVRVVMVENTPDIWTAELIKSSYEEASALEVRFPNIGCVRTFNGDVFVNNVKQLNVIIDGYNSVFLPEAPMSGQVTVKLTNVRYPQLFPSYKFTFTVSANFAATAN